MKKAPVQQSDTQVKSTKPPTYLGISLEEDQSMIENLCTLLKSSMLQAGEPGTLADQLSSILRTQKGSGQWKLPNSYHVTSMFIGGNKEKRQSR